MTKQEAWDDLARSEAKVMAELLAGDNRAVLVIVVAADSDDDGTTIILHEVAGNTTGGHLRQFIMGVERKLTWLRDKLYRRV